MGDEAKLSRIVQIILDVTGQPLKGLRILDLACLEGLYAIELACQGAEVVAIEGRKANIEKVRFVKDVLGLKNLELVQGDVRNLNREMYGTFDVVLNLGILYHLDIPDVFHFLARVAEMCQRISIIDTHVSIKDRESCLFNGKEYWGRTYFEHSVHSTPHERIGMPWASLDNVKSFWFTRPSLYNYLSQIGFKSVFECHLPFESGKPYDRVTLLAMKGRSVTFVSNPLINTFTHSNFPEKPELKVHPSQKRFSGLISRKIKERIKGLIK